MKKGFYKIIKVKWVGICTIIIMSWIHFMHTQSPSFIMALFTNEVKLFPMIDQHFIVVLIHVYIFSVLCDNECLCHTHTLKHTHTHTHTHTYIPTYICVYIIDIDASIFVWHPMWYKFLLSYLCSESNLGFVRPATKRRLLSMCYNWLSTCSICSLDRNVCYWAPLLS